MDVSKFNILGEEIDIKDKFLRDKITGLDLKSLAVIGDSNAEGYGWWKGNSSRKTNQNDGYCAVLRELYPDSTIDNYSLSGATLAYYNNSNYLDTQINSMLNANVNYQHIIIQAGFNDIALHVNDSENFIGICGYGRDELLARTDINTCVGALSYYINKIKKSIPKTKIHFLIRESQYGANTNLQNAYLSFYREISKVCQITGVDLWNLAYDNITSNIIEQKNIYYFDTVHWNETAYREIVTPFIISSLMGIPSGSPVTMNDIMYVNSFTYLDCFNNELNIGENSNIGKFIEMIPIEYYYEGLLCDKNVITIGCRIIKKAPYVHIEFFRNNNYEHCIVEGIAYPYKKVKTVINIQNTLERPLETIGNGYLGILSNLFNLESGLYGITNTVVTPNGNYLKRYTQTNNATIESLFNKDGELIKKWYHGGVLDFNIDLKGDQSLNNGIYYVPLNNLQNVSNKPTDITKGFILIVAREQTLYGYMICINFDGIWITGEDGSGWKKLV